VAPLLGRAVHPPEEEARGLGRRGHAGRCAAYGGILMGWRECEDVLELVLLKMKGARTAEECREAVEAVLALVKEKKFERLRKELGVLE